MATIHIPTPLRAYTNGETQITVSGTTVGAALQDLTSQHTQLQQHLYSEKGELRAFVNIFLDSDDVRNLKGEDTPLEENSRLRIVPSVAGGLQ
ncbi:MAG: MoaD/ThiS family protein [Anaerolineales bacterium]|jgi:adenylyltransferase/sulfurtransferase|nr:MoaD/ThiS family protein [Anaerolineales bacterium]